MNPKEIEDRQLKRLTSEMSIIENKWAIICKVQIQFFENADTLLVRLTKKQDRGGTN